MEFKEFKEITIDKRLHHSCGVQYEQIEDCYVKNCPTIEARIQKMEARWVAGQDIFTGEPLDPTLLEHLRKTGSRRFESENNSNC